MPLYAASDLGLHCLPLSHKKDSRLYGLKNRAGPGRVVQSVTCLTADMCLTADPGVASSIPARSHTFMDIDHEIISTVILLLPLIQEELLSVTS